jgi:hypothetical protein
VRKAGKAADGPTADVGRFEMGLGREIGLTVKAINVRFASFCPSSLDFSAKPVGAIQRLERSKRTFTKRSWL